MIDHFEALMDSPFLRWFDLQGQAALIEITDIEQRELTLAGGSKRRCPVMTFRQLQGRIESIKPLILNKTNIERLAAIHGPKPSKWVGQSIVLFEDWTEFRKERVRCIRLRARKPTTKQTPPPSPEGRE